MFDSASPTVLAECLLINSSISLISAGTERMLVDFGRASYLDKARQQPEKVRMVLEKIATDGLVTTMEHSLYLLDTVMLALFLRWVKVLNPSK